MMGSLRLLVTLGAAALVAPATALAQTNASAPAPRLHHASATLGPAWGFHGYGLGVDARVGYSYGRGARLYVGLAMDYHFGVPSLASATGGNLTVTERSMTHALEAGADMRLGSVLLRPYATVGGLWRAAACEATCAEYRATTADIVVGIGGSAFYVADWIMFGANARVLLTDFGGASVSAIPSVSILVGATTE